jgi:hypothetical protein
MYSIFCYTKNIIASWHIINNEIFNPLNSEQEINRALKAIIASDTFSKSVHSKQLLEYFVKATLDKRDIKEYTIAQEIFKKESDTGVRAYIHNLRKKLVEYYATEGINSEYILTIPKGQYHVQIHKKNQGNDYSVKKYFRTTLRLKYFIVAIGFAFFTLVIFFLLNNWNKKIENTFIWGDVIDSQSPLLIVVGDHYFYSAKVSSGRIGVMRDFYINSEEEMNEIVFKNKAIGQEDSISKLNYSYITKQGLMSIFKLRSYLKNTQNVQLVLSSELTFDQIKNNNILYLGKYYSLGVLKSLVDNKYFHGDRKLEELIYFKKDSIIRNKLIMNPVYKEDFPLVLKFKTPYNKTVMMFVGADDPAISATLDYFLELKNISMLEKKFQLSSKENSFSTLFKVEGLGRTDYSIKFITGEKISN